MAVEDNYHRARTQVSQGAGNRQALPKGSG